MSDQKTEQGTAANTSTEQSKAKTKTYELLADGIRLDDREYRRGDTVELTEEHGERLREHGSVGPVGVLKRRAEAEAKAQQLRDDAEKDLFEAEQNLVEKRGPGRPPRQQQ